MKKLILFLAILISCSAIAQPKLCMTGVMFPGVTDTFAHWVNIPGYDTISNDNLTFTGTPGQFGWTTANKKCYAGIEYYWEITINAKIDSLEFTGLALYTPSVSIAPQPIGQDFATLGWRGQWGWCISDDLAGGSYIISGSGCHGYSAGDILSFRITSGGTLRIYDNGTLQASYSLGSNFPIYPACGSDGSTPPGKGTANFGATPYTYKASICPSCQNL